MAIPILDIRLAHFSAKDNWSMTDCTWSGGLVLPSSGDILKHSLLLPVL